MVKRSFVKHALIALCAAFAVGGCQGNTTEHKDRNVVYENVSTRGPAVLPAQLKPDFIKAADVTALPSMQKDGLKVYGFDGALKDPLLVLKEQGFNYVKLTQLVYPFDVLGQSYGSGVSPIADNVALLKAASELNLSVLLDLSLSDFFTDASHQVTPMSWSKLSFADLEKTVNAYANNTVSTFLKEGVSPSIIEIGSGLNQGLLWPYGKVSNSSLKNAAKLINGAVDGVKKAYASYDKPMPKIMLSLDLQSMDNVNAIKAWLSDASKEQLSFNLLALNVNASDPNLAALMQNAITEIGSVTKADIVVTENNLALQQTNSGNKCDAMSDESSLNHLRSVLEAISNTEHGVGYIFWEPMREVKKSILLPSAHGMKYLDSESTAHSHVTDKSICTAGGLFDEKGRVLKSIKVFNDFM